MKRVNCFIVLIAGLYSGCQSFDNFADTYGPIAGASGLTDAQTTFENTQGTAGQAPHEGTGGSSSADSDLDKPEPSRPDSATTNTRSADTTLDKTETSLPDSGATNTGSTDTDLDKPEPSRPDGGTTNTSLAETALDKPEPSRPDRGATDTDLQAQNDAAVDASNDRTADNDGVQLSEIRLPPVNAPFDYQLGGAYTPPAGVQVVSRDRNDKPVAGFYNICYINGYQIQPGEEASWEADLILRDKNGVPIIDEAWNETLLDVTTENKRTRIAAVVGGWIEKCAADGFDAIEIDNLDTYSRSGGRISQDNAVVYLAALSGIAHKNGLAVAQKNSAELLGRRAQMGTDFSVAESCSRYSECGDYIDAYGQYVLMIEYRDSDFTKGCSQYGATHAIVRRDLNLVPPTRSGYVYNGC